VNPFEPPEVDVAPGDEVRRCAGCGAAAMIGLPAAVPRSLPRTFLCQACGRAVVVHPARWVPHPMLFAGAMLAAFGASGAAVVAVDGLPERRFALLGISVFLLVLGVSVCASILSTDWARWRNPVVDGAAAPPVRFVEAYPRRRCRCGVEVPCVGVSTGRAGDELEYRCEACGRAFTVEGPYATVYSLTASALSLAIAVGFLSAQASITWDDLLPPSCCVLVAVGSVGLSLVRYSARRRHPVVGR
jgi:hypothetical protein